MDVKDRVAHGRHRVKKQRELARCQHDEDTRGGAQAPTLIRACTRDGGAQRAQSRRAHANEREAVRVRAEEGAVERQEKAQPSAGANAQGKCERLHAERQSHGDAESETGNRGRAQRIPWNADPAVRSVERDAVDAKAERPAIRRAGYERLRYV